jgi:hypothetical protein
VALDFRKVHRQFTVNNSPQGQFTEYQLTARQFPAKKQINNLTINRRAILPQTIPHNKLPQTIHRWANPTQGSSSLLFFQFFAVNCFAVNFLW